MNPADSFIVSERLGKISAWIFWGISALTAALLLFSAFEWLLNPFLILGSIAGLVCGVLVNINLSHGNRWQRAAQLTDAFGVSVGSPARPNYYNSPLSHSLTRLATTTLENTLFTTKVLTVMLWRKRAFATFYLALFILVMGLRRIPTGGLLFFAQVLFSADVLLKWIKMEVFRFRVAEVHGHLRQFFLQGPKEDFAGVAIILAEFTNYECAKDEAGIAVDSKIFHRINPEVSEEWEKLKKELKIA